MSNSVDIKILARKVAVAEEIMAMAQRNAQQARDYIRSKLDSTLYAAEHGKHADGIDLAREVFCVNEAFESLRRAKATLDKLNDELQELNRD